MKIQPEQGSLTADDSLMDWHANLITMDHRQVVVLMNDQTRSGIVLFDLTANDFYNCLQKRKSIALFVWMVQEVHHLKMLVEKVVMTHF